MEHRCSKRVPTSCAVDLFRGDCSVVRGRLCNVSKDGALLDAGPLPYCCHVIFELSATTPDTRSRRLRGLVIHRNDQRLGIKLLDTWTDTEWNALTERQSRDARRHVSCDAGEVGNGGTPT